MIAFIDAHRDAYGVEPICAMLPIAPSSCYEAKAREGDPERLPARVKRDAALRPEVDNREAIAVARCTVARLMGELDLRGVVRGRRAKTTVPVPVPACPQDRARAGSPRAGAMRCGSPS